MILVCGSLRFPFTYIFPSLPFPLARYSEEKHSHPPHPGSTEAGRAGTRAAAPNEPPRCQQERPLLHKLLTQAGLCQDCGGQSGQRF